MAVGAFVEAVEEMGGMVSDGLQGTTRSLGEEPGI